MAIPLDFFHVGGTMGEDAPSYIERPADNELLTALEQGKLCLVLAPRQSGKSSLMVHTAARLRKKEVISGIVDLQRLGRQNNPNRWFGAVVNQIKRSLKLKTNSIEWWKSYSELDTNQRFANFLEDVVLTELKENVVLFFDEIDSVLKLDFSDDFFTTIRSIYNARSTEPKLKRLTFVLMGVATASSFIRERSRTPFNIGNPIELDDFERSSTEPFKEVFGSDSEPLIEQIFYWTNGQPYLVQKLAATVYELQPEERTPQRIDREVEHAYLQRKIEQDTHFKFIQDYLLANVNIVKETFATYRDVLEGQEVVYNEQSLVHNRLKLSGIIKIRDNKIVLRNRIYETVFNHQWLQEYVDLTHEKISLVSDARSKVSVPGYEYDVFVSYAQIDDQTFPGTNEGWVTTLVKTLRVLLAQKLGYEASFFSMNNLLPGNVLMTPEIMEVLHKSATFIVILSQGYLSSEWCQREKNSFLSMVQERIRSDIRVFIVEIDGLSPEERPSEFGNLRGYRFWETDRNGKTPRLLGMPNPQGDYQYYNRLNDLSYDLAEELRRLKAYAENIQENISLSDDTRPTVFLADVTDDLYFIREDVKRYLTQSNLRVLPETYYPYEPKVFQQAVYHDLSQAELFVQLLSEIPGRKLPDMPQGYIRRQYELARELNTPILQWRSPELPMHEVQDDDQRDFLQVTTVLAVGIEEFKFEILRRLSYKTSALSPFDSIGLGIFVNADPKDAALSESICEVIKERKVPYVSFLPDGKSSPRENREAFEQFVLNCDGIIVIYGMVDIQWVSQQILAISKMAWQRERPLTAFAIYDGPPENKPPLMLKFPGNILHSRNYLDEEQLRHFIQQLQEGKQRYE